MTNTLNITLPELAYLTKLAGLQNGNSKAELIQNSIRTATNSAVCNKIDSVIISENTDVAVYAGIYNKMCMLLQNVTHTIAGSKFKVLYKTPDGEFGVSKSHYTDEDDFNIHRDSQSFKFVQLIEDSRISVVQLNIVSL